MNVIWLECRPAPVLPPNGARIVGQEKLDMEPGCRVNLWARAALLEAMPVHSDAGIFVMSDTRYAIAQIHYQRFDMEQCLIEIEQVLELNPNNANYLAISALFLMGLGQRERGLALMRKSMRLNPHHPGWYHVVPLLHHYYGGEHKMALLDAKRINTPDYFWDPLTRAAVLGQLGRQAEAKKAGSELLALVPDFKRCGRSLIQGVVWREEHTETLLDGLQMAGLKALKSHGYV